MTIPLLTNLYYHPVPSTFVNPLTVLPGYDPDQPQPALPNAVLDVTSVGGLGSVNGYSIAYYNELGAQGNDFITW